MQEDVMDSRRCFAVLVLVGGLVLAPGLDPVAGAAPELFTVQWEPHATGGVPAVQGYLENHSTMRVGDVRLRVDTVDERGAVVAECFGWVIGDVPAGGRGFFLIRVRVPGPSYRISVESYDAIAPAGEAP
jgi:hypothetical protein